MTSSAPSRRQVLRGLAAVAGGAVAAGALGACTRAPASGSAGMPTLSPAMIDRIEAAEAARAAGGSVRRFSLVARPAEVDLGGVTARTWTYGGELPGKALRVTAGDRVRVEVTNQLPESTSVHWHGLAIRNDMDGVPHVTTPQIEPGTTFRYEFVVPDPGTHWFHPHHGLQLDRGLYAPFIIDARDEPGAYDTEWVVVLDDWTDGVGRTPEQVYAELRAGAASGGADGGTGDGMHGMGGMGGGTDGGMGGMHGGMTGMDHLSPDGDVGYPLHLINGRGPNDPEVRQARPGQRVRLRLINAAADTVFTVALGGHRLVVTHCDGYPVQPQETPALRIGMGERYDAVVTVSDGVFPLVAEPSGKAGVARALLSTAAGPTPGPDDRPAELSSSALTVTDLTAREGTALPPGEPDTRLQVNLAGTMRPYVWTINGTTYENTVPLTIRPGQRGLIHLHNHSMMSHPVHLHGHSFQLGPAGGDGPRKDTLLLPPMAGAQVSLVADNPGLWMVHCHNAYHAEAGMMTRLDYLV